MMIDMIVLCATLALSLFFWILSLTMSSFYGELPEMFLFSRVPKWEINPLNLKPPSEILPFSHSFELFL